MTLTAALLSCQYLMQDGFADRCVGDFSPDEVINTFNTGEEEAQAGKLESSC